MNKPRGPAAAVILRPAAMTFGYTPACTERMHTAAGTLTIEDPRAPIPPATNAICDTGMSDFSWSNFFAVP